MKLTQILIVAMLLALPLASAQDELAIEDQSSYPQMSLPNAGITPMDSKLLWRLDLMGESIKEKWYDIAKSQEERNLYRMHRAEERLMEYEFTYARDKDKAKDIELKLNEIEASMIDSEKSAPNILRHVEVLLEVKAKLEAKGVPTQGIENALNVSAKTLSNIKAKEESGKIHVKSGSVASKLTMMD